MTRTAPWLLVVLALGLSACASSGPSGPDLDRRLLGVWEDDDGQVTTITEADGAYAIGIVDFDDEVFDVVSVDWDGAALTWVYDVPSTGYRVTYTTTQIAADRVDVRWENQTGASGVEGLTRRR